MNSFRVWAPKANRVEVDVRGERLLMSAGENGWWFAEISSVEPGTDYAFVLDGGKPLPDPRSPWQPHGINGPSRTIDHGAFPWTDRHWQARPLSAAVFYELHIGTFTPQGTFKAADRKTRSFDPTRHHACRTHAGCRIFRKPRLGLRWRLPLRAASCLR
jgi:maltooligosyltrehalose trehalohydrolase